MSARWKRNAVVATMAVLVCAAVALNWKYTGQQAAEGVEETGTKILGEATLVNGQEDGRRPGRRGRGGGVHRGRTTSPPPG